MTTVGSSMLLTSRHHVAWLLQTVKIARDQVEIVRDLVVVVRDQLLADMSRRALYSSMSTWSGLAWDGTCDRGRDRVQC